MAMDSMSPCRTYFEAWNRRDADAIVATFAPSGHYSDPTTGGPLSGESLKCYVEGLVSAFPDLSFDIVSVGEAGDGLVAAQWIMRGRNDGSFSGLPPTGRTVELEGADFIRVSDRGIESVTGYFDGGAVPRQLGLDVIVQPKAIGPFAFGVCTVVESGSSARPGAFSITELRVRTDDEIEKVRDYSRRIAEDMLGMDGFITLVTARAGTRMVTVTAWERPEQVNAVYHNTDHAAAVREFYGESIAAAGMVSLNVPSHMSRMLRCERCGTMQKIKEEGDSQTCECGAGLPHDMPWW
jgi:steroid delta-isomerase-like uncharacterized protein